MSPARVSPPSAGSRGFFWTRGVRSLEWAFKFQTIGNWRRTGLQSARAGTATAGFPSARLDSDSLTARR